MKRLSVSAVWLVALAAVSMAPAAVARGRHAFRPIVDSDPISEASLRAAQYWRVIPCAGQVTIVAGLAAEAPASGANDGEAIRPAAMWASWSTPWGANLFDVPGVTPAQAIEPARFSNCVVHVDLAVWPDWHRDDARFESFCKEIVHEYGHLAGHPDVGAARGTVEYEQPDLASVAPCERYRLVYGHRTFSPPPPKSVRRGYHRHRHAR